MLISAYIWFRRVVASFVFALVAVLDYQFWWPADAEHVVFGTAGCGEPCVIFYNGGGNINAFIRVANKFLRNQRLVSIDGPCYSACTIMAGLARPYVCITDQAEFHFHKAIRFTDGWRSDPPMSLDIDAWVSAYGGYPEEGYLEMDFENAKDFWPVCTAEQRAAL